MIDSATPVNSSPCGSASSPTPAWPWLPVPPQQEGSYYYVSKNVIEMLALLSLATTPSGRWFGIDGVLHQVFLLVFGRARKVS